MDMDFLEAARRRAEAEQKYQAAEDEMRSLVNKWRGRGLTDREIADGVDLTEEEFAVLMDESTCRVCGHQRFTDKDFAELTRSDDKVGDENGRVIRVTRDVAMEMLGEPWVSKDVFVQLVCSLREWGVPETDIRKASELGDEEFDERMRD